MKIIEIIYGSRSRYNFAYTVGFKNDVTVKHEKNSVEECIERCKELIVNKEIKVKLTPENESNYRRL